MTEDEVALLRDWIAANLPLVTPDRSQTEHLSRLFSTAAGSDILAIGLEAYQRTVSILGAQTRTIMVALVIPLQDVDVLVPGAPESDDILHEMSAEPPSLALIHRDALKAVSRFEEYRVPARIPRLGGLPESYCFLRMFRDEDAMRRGWEFGRCVTLCHVGAEHTATEAG